MAPTPLLLMCSIIKLIEEIYLYKALARIMCLLKCGPWLLQKKKWHPRCSIHHANNFYVAPTVRVFSLMIERLRQSTTGRNVNFSDFWINCISNTFQTVAIRIAKLNRKQLNVLYLYTLAKLMKARSSAHFTVMSYYWKLCFRFYVNLCGIIILLSISFRSL